ncbi:MAG: hypothetical protein ABIW76_22870 [Fibrobacteria bacterium]
MVALDHEHDVFFRGRRRGDEGGRLAARRLAVLARKVNPAQEQGVGRADSSAGRRTRAGCRRPPYGTCDRDYFYPQIGSPMAEYRDRFTGKKQELSSATFKDILEITIANELETCISGLDQRKQPEKLCRVIRSF